MRFTCFNRSGAFALLARRSASLRCELLMPRYSATVMDHFQSPRNWGKLATADSVGVAGVPGGGRFLVLSLRLDAGRIAATGFQCHGCGATIAAGSILTEMVTGLTMDECRQLSADDLLTALDGLPADKRHCARFALDALHDALDAQSANAGNGDDPAHHP